VHDKKSVGHVPIIINKDIDLNSPAWNQDYAPSEQNYLMASMVDMHPLCVLSLAPSSMALAGAIIGGKLSLPETMGATPWKKLDSTQYCMQGGFTRADWELIQSVSLQCQTGIGWWQTPRESTRIAPRSLVSNHGSQTFSAVHPFKCCISIMRVPEWKPLPPWPMLKPTARPPTWLDSKPFLLPFYLHSKRQFLFFNTFLPKLKEKN
jgi:hypothetical protein